MSSSTENRPSRWGHAVDSASAPAAGNSAWGIDHRSGGIYGPADTGRPSGGSRGWGGGGGGRAQGNGAPRDESWVEHRLKLRAEARAPRGVWNRSPSPPKKKEAKPVKTTPAPVSRKPQRKSRGEERDRKVTRPVKKSRRTDSSKTQRRRALSTSSSDSSSSASSSSDSSSSDSSGSSSSSDSGSSDSSDEEGNKSKKRPSSPSISAQGKLSKASRSASPAPSIQGVTEDDVDLNAAGHDKVPSSVEEMDELDAAEAAQFKADVQGHRQQEESDEEVGPMPVPQLDELQGEGERGVNYGGALLPGEGAAIAQFVQKGLRIPRRGEVGWAGQEIEKLEDSGYVMSGSRHARMNAVRLRKENQVFNAEERRALALIMFEEKQQKENEILGNFRQMLTESSQEGDKPSAEGSSAA
ncbi:unnamed protein product [Scytosiphon promiscuus]